MVMIGNDRLSTTVYRKKTHINCYTHYNSKHHPMNQVKSNQMFKRRVEQRVLVIMDT